MERVHRPLLTLFSGDSFDIGAELRLPEDAAHHVQVRRARVGDGVRLLDGRGRVGTGTLAVVGRREVIARLDAVVSVPRPGRLELVVPVADRDRMLLAAEKAVELQATGWHPAVFARSHSVGSRGEGERFRGRLLARMRSALEQSGGAWLPDVQVERDGRDALDAVADVRSRFLLDAAGAPLAREGLLGEVAVAAGPEGGFEPEEVGAAERAGWARASLGTTTLRFETAIIAAAAVIRATQFSGGRS